MTLRREPWAIRHWAATVVLALLPTWVIGVCARDLWKPDEPREAAIAARMARPGADWAVPHLGTRAFCEKPPLTYWVAAVSARAFGPGIVPLRLPNLAYGLLGALLVGLLARGPGGRVAALAAGLLMGTLYLAFRVGIWLATDALLMCTVAGALLGAFRGLLAHRGLHKLGWYSLMHVFLAAGFLTKNVVAWIVPALAWLTLVVWERRWREVAAWELWAGVVVQAALVAPWVASLAAEPEGATYLRLFFRDNLLGRFTPIEGVDLTQGHRGWPGMYLFELPMYLFPWMFVAVGAAAMAWHACRGTGTGTVRACAGERSAWRFAIGAIVLPLLLLSASATMRDIYAGVLMPPFALLGGLWAARALAAPGRLDLAMGRATTALFVVMALAVPPTTLAAVVHFGAPAPFLPVAILGLSWLIGMAVAWRGWSRARRGRIGAALAHAALLAVLAAPALGPLVVPVVNRAQSLRPVALAAREVATGRTLALWQPDETMIAAMDFEVGLTPLFIDDIEAARQRLAADSTLVLLAAATPHKGNERDLARLEGELGLAVMRRVDLPEPGGRSYALLGRPRS